MRLTLPLLAFAFLLTACGREEEPVANRFERQKAEIENKARAYEAQVENEVSAIEARLENEARALLNSIPADANGAETEAEANTQR
jgi:hypothetical protein